MSREVKYILRVDTKNGTAKLGQFERATGSATQKLRDQRKAADSASHGLSSFGKAIAAVGGAAAVFTLVNMTKQFVGLAMAQQDAEIAMSAALKVTGEYTEKLDNQFKSFASSIQKVTTLGDEEVLKLMALQKNLGVSTDRLEEATKMSIGLAAATGRNAESMAMYVALAEKGEFTMLRRYIPALRATTDKTEQLKILTDFCARGFEVAKSKTETFSGALKQTSNTFGDLREKIGDFVVKSGAATEIVHFMDELFREWQDDLVLAADEFHRWVEENKEFLKQDIKSHLLGIRDGLQAIVGVWSALPDGIVGAAGTGLLTKILTGSTPLGRAAAALYLINVQMEKLGLGLSRVKDDSEGLAGNLGNLWDVVTGNKDWNTGNLIGFEGGSPGEASGAERGWSAPEESEKGLQPGAKGRAEELEEEVNAEIEVYNALENAKRNSWQATEDFWVGAKERRLAANSRYLSMEIAQEQAMAKAKRDVGLRTLHQTQWVLKEAGKHSKTAFRAFQTMSSAEALVSSHKAAIGAYAALADIPVIGPALGAAAAAAALAYGMAQVNSIMSLSSSSATGGGSVPTYSVSPISETPIIEEPIETAEKKGIVNIYVSEPLKDDYYIEYLAERLSEFVEDRDVRLIASSAQEAETLA